MGFRNLSRLIAAGTTHTNSTDEAALDSYTFPANFWQVGKVVRCKWAALVADNNSTDTLTTFVRLGATGLGDTAVFTSGAVDVADNDVSAVEVDLVCRSVGASGVVYAVARGSDPDAPHSKLIGDALTSVSVDTTAASTIVFSADWSVAHADNQVAAQFGTVDEIAD
jgi:hypothetical protein